MRCLRVCSVSETGRLECGGDDALVRSKMEDLLNVDLPTDVDEDAFSTLLDPVVDAMVELWFPNVTANPMWKSMCCPFDVDFDIRRELLAVFHAARPDDES